MHWHSRTMTLSQPWCAAIFGPGQHGIGPQQLADYIRETVALIERQASFELGTVVFPNPQRILLTPLEEGRDGEI